MLDLCLATRLIFWGIDMRIKKACPVIEEQYTSQRNQLAYFRLRHSVAMLGGFIFAALGVSGPAYAAFSGGDFYGTPCQPTLNDVDKYYVGVCVIDDELAVDQHTMTIESEQIKGIVGVWNNRQSSVSNFNIEVIDSKVQEIVGAQVSNIFVGVGHGTINDNYILVDNTDVTDNGVTGSYITGHTGEANRNYIEIINDSTVEGGVFGTQVIDGWGVGMRVIGTENQVVVRDSIVDIVTGAFLAGEYGRTTGQNNSVELYKSEAEDVFGAYLYGVTQGKGRNNTALINQASKVDSAAGIKISVLGDPDYPGLELTSDVTIQDNSLIISGASRVNSAFGAHIEAMQHFSQDPFELTPPKVTNNTLVINEQSQVGLAYGTFLDSEEDVPDKHFSVENSYVSLSDGSAAEKVYGAALLGNGTVTESTVEVKQGGIVHDSIYGGYVNQSGEVSKNTVHLSSGADVGDHVIGGFIEVGRAQDNVVTVEESLVEDYVVGGVVSHDGNAIGNKVSISKNSNISVAVGGVVSVGQAQGNEVVLADAVVRDSAIGGYTYEGTASENTVVLSGNSSVAHEVIGGQSDDGDAIGNRVRILGASDLSSAVLKGGVAANGQSTGNVLEVRSKNLQAHNIEDFQEYEFVLPSGTKAGESLLVLSDSAGTDLGEGTVRVGSESPKFKLEVGERVTLLNNAAGLNSEQVSGDLQSIPDGAFLIRDVALGRDAENLYLEVTGKSLTEQSKTPLEGRLGAFALLEQSAVRSGDALTEAVGATKDSENGTGLFAIMTGGGSRYKTGSHVDVKGVGLTLGAVKALETDVGITHVGAFVEGASGHHHSYNRFDDLSVRGHGSTRYIGAGVLAKHDWNADGQGGPYVEGSLRGGRLSMDWRTSDLPHTAGTVDYDSSGGYVAAHAGVGYTLPLSEKSSLDLSAKYFWTRLGSDDVRIDGEDFHMKAINSSVSHLGAKLKHQFDEHTTGYVGVAWEYEFNGKARASVHQLNPTAPSLKGSTGVLDAGLVLQPKADGPLSIQLGLRGYTGTRRGASGLLNINYAF